LSSAHSRFSAVNGRSEGAAVNVVTKSGSGDFHGSAFYFLRDKKLNASEVSRATLQSNPSRHSIASNGVDPLADRSICRGLVKEARATLESSDYFLLALERQNEVTSIPVASDAFAELTLAQSIGAQPATVPPYSLQGLARQRSHRSYIQLKEQPVR